MAEKRMFTKKITDSDAFLNMPLSTQALYFHLNMAADDEGFVNNPQKIQRVIGAAEDDLKLLMAKNFIIAFESGVIVIKHWRMHNYIAKDRFHATDYTEERSMLEVKENGSYKMPVYDLHTECIQDDDRDKNSIEEISIDKSSIDTPTPPAWEEDKHTNIENFEYLIETEMKDGMNTDLIQSIKDWLIYKDHRKPKRENHYQLESIRKLVNRAFKESQIHGVEAVVGIIDTSIMNNYQGIIWDSLSKAKPQTKNRFGFMDD